MTDKISGSLEVGPNDRGEVVIYLPPEVVADFSLLEGGHITFSPNQARNLAEILLHQAKRVDGQTLSNVAVEMRATLERIASRRPVTDKAGDAFYRSRQDAKDVLRKFEPSAEGASSALCGER